MMVVVRSASIEGHTEGGDGAGRGGQMPLPCALVDSTGFGAGMANVPQGGLQTARTAEPA
jgi:hypothetical protein